MSLMVRISALISAIGADVKDIYARLSGPFNLTASATNPGGPGSGVVQLFGSSIGGRPMPAWNCRFGVPLPAQPHLGFCRQAAVFPATAASVTALSTAVSNVGAVATPALANTNLKTQTRRFVLTSSASVGALASHRTTQTECWRDSGSGLGGFQLVMRFALEGTLPVAMRAFFGVWGSTAAPTNIDPIADTTISKCGLAINAGSGNWSIVSAASGSGKVATDLGPDFPVNATDVMELVLSCQAGYPTPSIGYRVTNLSTGATTTGTLLSYLPVDTFLGVYAWACNNTASTAVAISISGWALESDY